MSVNALIDQSHLPEVEALLSLLQQFVARWRSAPTFEQRLLVEAQAVSVFEELLNLSLNLQDVQAGQHPELFEFQETYDVYGHLLRINMAKLRSLAELFLQHFNSQQLQLLELMGKLKRIKQKQASLNLWSDDKAKFVLADHFLNLDWIGTAFTSATAAEVDSTQGLLTLPVRNRVQVAVTKTRVGSGSNGQPGNSDEVVTTNNTNPDFAVNGDPNNWFEYERLDAGPLELVYVLELGKGEIVNHLQITPLNLGGSYGFEVENITFTTSGGGTKRLDELVSGAFDDDFYTVKSLGADTSWNISFLPVVAKAISIKFVQRNPYQIEVATTDNRTVLRDRWAVALKEVRAFRLEYEQSGGINSTEREYPSGLYAALPFTDVWPRRPELFNACLEVSLDGGQTWEESTNLDDGIGSTILLDGEAGTFLWRMTLERDDAALDNITNFVQEESSVKTVQGALRTVSRFQSPANIPLREKPKAGEVFVLQPRLGRRGDRFDTVFIGEGTGQEISFELPFSVVENGLDPDDMKIYVDRRLYDYQPDDTVLAAGEWTFSDDFQEIVFSSDLPTGSRVFAVFDEEKMNFVEEADGFYHTMEMLFDPEKDNIVIHGLPREPRRSTRILPRDKTVFSLGFKNLIDESFSLTSSTAVTYTEVETRGEVISTANTYFIDYVNGVMWLNAAFGSDVVRASFTHMSPARVRNENFEVWYDGLRPAGVRIATDAFEATKATDTIGSVLNKRMNVLTGEYARRTNNFVGVGTARQLSYDNIVRDSVIVSDGLLGTTEKPEEVTFIDGKTEFLGLMEMNTEITGALTASTGTSYVTFTLAAGALWYSDFEVIFDDASVFATVSGSATAVQSGAAGDYFVAEDGLVTVNVGLDGTLTSGVGIVYYYQDPNFDPANKFSVDYREGVLYSDTTQISGSTVTYKASSYKVAYNIAQELDLYRYNSGTNSVQVRTEGMRRLNNLVKVLWEEAPSGASLRELKPFFSPMFSVLAFRCE